MSDGAPRRLTRAESKARTRELLLEAAGRVFARKGYAGASVEEIAESAGFSTGAVYSNFEGKEGLVVELLASRALDQIAEAVRTIANVHAGDEEPMRVLSRTLSTATGEESEFTLLQAELWLYAMRNPRLRETLARRMREPHDAMKTMLEPLLERIGQRDSVAPEQVATLVLALFHGLVRQRMADKELVPDDLFGQGLRWLFAGIAATGEAAAGTAAED